LVVLEAGGQEVGELASDGPVFRPSVQLARERLSGVRRGWLGHAKVDKPAYPPYNTAGWLGWLPPPFEPPTKPCSGSVRGWCVPPTAAGSNVPRAADLRVFSRRPPITAGRGRRLRVSPAW